MLTWISRFFWKQPFMSEWSFWCPLRDEVIKIRRKVLFAGMLNTVAYLIDCCSHDFQGFFRSRHLWAYHVDNHSVITSSDSKISLYFKCWLPMFIWQIVVDMHFKMIGICVSWPPALTPIWIWRSQSQICIYWPRSSICIYRPVSPQFEFTSLG